jgi:hypothetical protein
MKKKTVINGKAYMIKTREPYPQATKIKPSNKVYDRKKLKKEKEEK